MIYLRVLICCPPTLTAAPCSTAARCTGCNKDSSGIGRRKATARPPVGPRCDFTLATTFVPVGLPFPLHYCSLRLNSPLVVGHLERGLPRLYFTRSTRLTLALAFSRDALHTSRISSIILSAPAVRGQPRVSHGQSSLTVRFSYFLQHFEGVLTALCLAADAYCSLMCTHSAGAVGMTSSCVPPWLGRCGRLKSNHLLLPSLLLLRAPCRSSATRR